MTNDQALLRTLEDRLQDLNEIQDWIAHARVAAATNPVVQYNLDEKQIELDLKMMRVKAAIRYLNSRNA